MCLNPFQYRVLNHLKLYCIFATEAWLKFNINFDSRYLVLLTAFKFSLVFFVLNLRDKIESKYPSIVFLSILRAVNSEWQGLHLMILSNGEISNSKSHFSTDKLEFEILNDH